MKWTKEHEAFIREHAPGRHREESYKLFVKHFGIDPGLNSYIAFLKNHHIRCGVDCRYKKGHEPWSKGRPLTPEQREVALRTAFKKGVVPHNTLPIGSEVEFEDGYIWVKVAERRNPKNKRVNWIPKHRLVWEEANGPIPEGMYVTFLNGDRKDFRIENLALVSQATNATLNRKGLRSEHPEITEAGIALSELLVKITERSKQ